MALQEPRIDGEMSDENENVEMSNHEVSSISQNLEGETVEANNSGTF